MSNSVAKRLGDEDFQAELNKWLDILKKDKFVTFINGSVAFRLGDKSFLDNLTIMFDLLGIDSFTTYYGRTSCVCAFDNPVFFNSFRDVAQALDQEERKKLVTTFLTDSRDLLQRGGIELTAPSFRYELYSAIKTNRFASQAKEHLNSVNWDDPQHRVIPQGDDFQRRFQMVQRGLDPDMWSL